MKIHHIGYFVRDIKKAVDNFNHLGFKPTSEVVFDEKRVCDISFISNGGYVIELIQPKDKTSYVYSLSKKYKNSPYHICYEVNNLEKSIDELCSYGYKLVQVPSTAPAISMLSPGVSARVAFLYNLNLGLIELVDFEK